MLHISLFIDGYSFFLKGSWRVAMTVMVAWTLLSGCVERYHPDDLYLKKDLLVINAHISDNPGIQVIEISRSSHPEIPSFNGELNCFVQLFREDGESRGFSEGEQPGRYTAELDSDFLRTGMQYRLEVITQDGNEYHSDFDKIRPVPPIDSVYYKVETMEYPDEDDPVTGIRFYANLTYDDEAYEYIRWELTETYEFHNPYMDAFVYLNRWTPARPLEGIENSRICYITRAIPSTHTLSTAYLDFGPFTKSFDFVPNDQMEQKLLFKYSLLVRQYSLSPEGFHFWNEISANRQGQGSLFDKQPALLQSNICNINNEDEKVLGFFTMSRVQEFRAFAEEIPGLDRSLYSYYCLPVDKGPGSSTPTNWPAYFARATYDGATVYAEVNHHCVDCREYKNSSAEKPDFW